MIEDTIIDLDAYKWGIDEGICRIVDSFVYMEITITADMDVCIGLGVCVEVCPNITN